MSADTDTAMAPVLPPEIRKHFPFSSRFMRVNGHRMHYVDEGQGDPVLLLHGNPTWSYLYRKFIPPLVAAGYRAIAPDHIGFGLSDHPAREGDYSLENHIANLAEFIRQLGLTRVTVVCQDWGGPTGLACAVLQPDAVHAVVVMNTWAWPEPTAFHGSVFPWRMMHAPVVGPYLVPAPQCPGGTRPLSVGGPSRTISRRGLAGVPVRHAGLRQPAAHSRFSSPHSLEGRRPIRRHPALARTVPAQAENSRPHRLGPGGNRLSRECAQRFKELLPHADGPHWVTGSHFLQEDSPEEICAHLLDFLQSSRHARQA